MNILFQVMTLSMEVRSHALARELTLLFVTYNG